MNGIKIESGVKASVPCLRKENCINKQQFKREIGILKNQVENLNSDMSEVKTEIKNLVKLRENDSENISKIFEAIEDYKIFKAEKKLTNGQMRADINNLKVICEKEHEKEEIEKKEKKENKKKFRERLVDILLGALVTSLFVLFIKIIEFLTPL